MSCFGRCFSYVREWARYYINITKAASFLLGLMFAHGLVKNAVTDVLYWYITEEWQQVDIRKAAAIVNIEEGIAAIVAVVIAYLTHVYVGCFRMILDTTISFILGLVLLWLSTGLFPSHVKSQIFYLALAFIALGKAGQISPLIKFLTDQLSGVNDEQREGRTNFWWNVARFLGATVSSFFLAKTYWKDIVKISAIVMGAFCVVFLSGIFSPYRYTPPTGRPGGPDYSKFGRNEQQHLPGDSNFSRKEEAITTETTSSSQDPTAIGQLPEPEIIGEPSGASVEPMEAIRYPSFPQQELETEKVRVEQGMRLRRLIPLWATFIVYGMVQAAGSTFFLEQSNGMKIGIFPVNALFIIKSLTSSISSYLVDLFIARQKTEVMKQRASLVGIGIGFVISIICCEVAAAVEHKRLDLAYIDGNEDIKIRMNIMWLTPQFFLLGLMDGFAEKGLGEFFDSHVVESKKYLGTPMNELVMSAGKILSVLCVFIVRDWFGLTLFYASHLYKLGLPIITSHLYKYFHLLAILSGANLFAYILIAICYARIFQDRQQIKQQQAGEQQDVQQTNPQNHVELGVFQEIVLEYLQQ